MHRITALFLLAILLAGCTSQVQVTPTPSSGGSGLKAEKGDVVSVDYVGSLDDGTVFDTSLKLEAQKAGLEPRPSYEPLEFTVGAGQMIKGFDQGVVGMKKGETKTVRIEPEDAYGGVRQDLIVSLNASQFGDRVPKKGDKLQASNGMVATVANVTNATVTIDANHPLAGKALNFKIIMREIQKK